MFTTTSIEHDDNSATFTLQDDIAGLELLIELQLDFNSDVVQKRITVTNTTAGEYCLGKLSSTLPLPNHANELMTFHGRGVMSFKLSV